MAEYNLGTARGVIEIDYTGKPAVDQATEDIEGIGKTGGKTDASLKKVGTAAGVTGLAIAGGFGLAIKAASDFEYGLDGIQAVSGATAGEMDAVRKKALQLGADTAFSAGEASTAMEELVKAGISIPDVLNGAADSVVALAAAGNIDLPAAATIAANAMNQFGLEADKMPGIADKIAGAANASAIDVSDFGQSMSQVGAVANLAGLSFDDTALAIAAMGNAGVKGSDAGTSLKTMIMNLQPQTKKQAGLMKELGIITKDGTNQFFDASGKMKSMSEISGVLGKSLDGMSDKQKTMALQTLFGSDAVRAAAVVADTGSAGFDKLGASIDKTKAADVAADRMGNMKGSLEQLKGSAETMAITVGSVFIPALTSLIDKLTGLVNWFTNLSGTQQKWLIGTIAAVGGILLLVAAFIKIVSFVKNFIAAVKAVQAAWVALNITFSISPLGLIIIAIIALVVALVLLYKKNEAFRALVQKVWAAIKSAIGAVVDWITGTAVPWLINAWNTIKEGAQSLWDSIVSVWNSIKDGIASAVNAIKTVITTVFGIIKTVVMTYFNIYKTIIMTVLNVIKAIWTGVWNFFAPVIRGVFDIISAIIEVAVAWIKVFIQAGLNFILGVWRSIWNTIMAVVTPVWNFIKTMITIAIGQIKTVINTVLNVIRAVWTTVWNAIKAVAQRVWNSIKAYIIGPIQAIAARIASWIATAKSVISAGFNAVKSKVASIWQSIIGVIAGKIATIKDKISGMISTVKGFFSGAIGWLKQAGIDIVQGLINGVTSMIKNVGDALSGIADKIRGFLPGSPIREGPLKEHGWNDGKPGARLVQSLASGIEDEIPALERAFANLPTDVPISLGSADVALAGSASRTGTGVVAAEADTAAAGALRLVEGRLALDPSGRAFISGVAQEVVDTDKSFAGTTGRMGGF